MGFTAKVSRVRVGKGAFLLLCLCLNSIYLKAQFPENNWIKPNQAYLKLSVVEDGIYKVTAPELREAGWELETINAANLQLFYRGRELGIYVSTNENNTFKNDDFVLFYGQKNDGSRDSLMYRAAERANPFHNLYSDTTVYFLTVGNAPGKRIEVLANADGELTDEPFHLTEEVTVYDEQFSFNNIIGLVPLLQQSYFEEGEGRTGKYIVSDSVARFSYFFKNRYKTADYQPIIEYRINGRSRVNHRLMTIFSPLDTANFTVRPFGVSTQKKVLSENLITNETVQFSLISAKKEPLDWYSMTFVKTVYPQRFLMGNERVKYFNLLKGVSSQTSVFIADFTPENLLWNVSDLDNPQWLLPSAANRYSVTKSGEATKLFAAVGVSSVNKISRVSFRDFSKQTADYLIITHGSLLASAQVYADYRASAAGGGYTPIIVTTQELYDAFNFGENSPVALRNFAEMMLEEQQPKHLLLLGRAVSFPDELRRNNFPNLVPTFGYPGSDALITAGLGGFPEDVQAISTGRLNVTKNQEVLGYLEKVKAAEATKTPEIWQKSILHLSGGQSENETRTLGGILNSLAPIPRAGLLGGKVDSRRKRTNLEIEPIDIAENVNAGLGMITFVGHGSANQIDLNIGYCSPPENGFANEGKYPLMFFNGCGVGNVFYRYNALSTDWLLTPKKGAIAVFANSFWSYAYPTEVYLNVLYQKLFSDPQTVNLTLGEIQRAAHLQLVNQSLDDYIKANVHQMILQGDPALRIFQLAKSDYEVAKGGVFIASVNESQVMSKNDSLKVGLILRNMGRYDQAVKIPVELIKTYQNGNTELLAFEVRAVAFQDTVYTQIQYDSTLQKIELRVNPREVIAEYNYANNIGSLELTDWSSIGDFTSFPAAILPDKLPPSLLVTINGKLHQDNDYVVSSPQFSLELLDNQTLDSSSIYHFEVLLKDCESCDFQVVELPQRVVGSVYGTNFQMPFSLSNLAAGTYFLRIQARDKAGNRLREPYEVRFRVATEKLPLEVVAFPSPGRNVVQIRYQIVDVNSPEKIQIQVYSSTGQLVHSATQTPTVGQNSYFLNTKNLPAGRFFVQLILDDAEVVTTSFVVN